jgi:hypothetical protein
LKQNIFISPVFSYIRKKMVELNLGKDHIYLILAIFIFVIAAGIAIAAVPSNPGHDIAQIEGLSDYLSTNSLLNAKAVVCPSGQCIKSITSAGTPTCEEPTVSGNIVNDWVIVADNTQDCSWNCKYLGFNNGGGDNGKMCKDISGKAGNYLQPSGGNPNFQWCISTSPASSGILQQCYCIGYTGSGTCPTPTQQPVSIPVSCHSYSFNPSFPNSITTWGCSVSCPKGWDMYSCSASNGAVTYTVYSNLWFATTTGVSLDCTCTKPITSK